MWDYDFLFGFISDRHLFSFPPRFASRPLLFFFFFSPSGVLHTSVIILFLFRFLWFVAPAPLCPT